MFFTRKNHPLISHEQNTQEYLYNLCFYRFFTTLFFFQYNNFKYHNLHFFLMYYLLQYTSQNIINILSLMCDSDHEFQLLISHQDFLKFQSLCQNFQLSEQKLRKQNQELDMRIYALNQQNEKLQKKITQLMDGIKYLSQKGIQMSKKLIDLDQENNFTKTEMVKTEIEMAKRYKSILASNKELQGKLVSIMNENYKIKDELRLKSEEMKKLKNTEKLAKDIQVSPEPQDKQVLVELISPELLAAKQRIEELQAKIQLYNVKNCEMTQLLDIHKIQALNFQEAINEIQQENNQMRAQQKQGLDKIKFLQQNFNKLRCQLKESRKLEEQKIQLAFQIKVYQQEYINFKKEIKFYQNRIKFAEDLEAKNEENSTKIKQLQAQLTEEKEKNAEQIKHYNETIKNMATQMTRMKVQKSQSTKVTEELSELYANSRKENKALQQQLQKCKNKTQSLEKTEQKMKFQVEKFRKLVEDYQHKSQSLLQLSSVKDETIRILNNQLIKLKNQMQKTSSEYKTEIQQLSEANKQLKEESSEKISMLEQEILTRQNLEKEYESIIKQFAKEKEINSREHNEKVSIDIKQALKSAIIEFITE